jgi:hypothetical protein
MLERRQATEHGRIGKAGAACYHTPGAPMPPTTTDDIPFVLIATPNASRRVEIARLVTRLGMVALASLDGEATMSHSHRQRLWGVILDTEQPSADGGPDALVGEMSDGGIYVIRQHDEQAQLDGPPQGPELSTIELARIAAWLQGLGS